MAKLDSNDFLNWDWSTNHVGGHINTGEYVTSEASILLAGPARLLNASTTTASDTKTLSLTVIGKLAQFDLNETKTVNPVFEIGAKRAYMLSEKSTYMGNLTGFLAFRESLLKLMYSGWTISPAGVATSRSEPDTQVPVKNDKPGYGKHYNALSSKLFTVPIGLCVLHRTNRDQSYSATYLEDVVVDNYHIGFQSNQAILIESIRFMSGYVVPINLSTEVTVSVST